MCQICNFDILAHFSVQPVARTLATGGKMFTAYCVCNVQSAVDLLSLAPIAPTVAEMWTRNRWGGGPRYSIMTRNWPTLEPRTDVG